MSIIEFFFLPVAFAASSGAEGHSSPIVELIFPLVNFLIFGYLVRRFGIPPILQYLRVRREKIVNAVNTAAEAKSEAERYVQQYQDLLGRLQAEGERIKAEFRAEAERERERILAAAEDTAAKLKADAAFLAEQEVKIARHQVRVWLADAAQAAAAKAVHDHLTPDDQTRLVDDFTQQIRNLQ